MREGRPKVSNQIKSNRFQIKHITLV